MTSRRERLAAIADRSWVKGRCTRCAGWGDECSCAENDVDWLLADIAQLEKALEAAREGHEIGCSQHMEYPEPCDCGFVFAINQALAGVERRAHEHDCLLSIRGGNEDNCTCGAFEYNAALSGMTQPDEETK